MAAKDFRHPRREAWDRPQTAEEEKQDEWFNDLWQEMDEKLRHRLWGLSADLNTLGDGEKSVDVDWPPIPEEELKRVQSEAFISQDWDKFLESLRRPPRFRSRSG